MILALSTTAPAPSNERRSPAQDRPDRARAVAAEWVRLSLPHKPGVHALTTKVGARRHLGVAAIPPRSASDPEQPDERPAQSP